MRSSLKNRASITISVGVVLAVILCGCDSLSRPQPPLSFNHEKHVALNMDCQSCHPYVRQAAVAGVISVRQCYLCHSKDTAHAEVSFVLDLVRRKEEARWERVYNVPDGVIFSHRRHVVMGKIECKTCHGEVSAMAKLISNPVAKTLRMDGCLSCHERKGVTIDCISCHK